MAVKDITDMQVLKAYKQSWDEKPRRWPEEILKEETGQCYKVCHRAMERAYSRGFIEYGVSLRSGWLTDRAQKLLTEPADAEGKE